MVFTEYIWLLPPIEARIPFELARSVLQNLIASILVPAGMSNLVAEPQFAMLVWLGWRTPSKKTSIRLSQVAKRVPNEGAIVVNKECLLDVESGVA